MPEKSWSVEFSNSALKALQRLDKKASLRVLDRLGELADAENPLRHKDVRSLDGKLKEFYRFRVGEYRVIFELDPRDRRIGVLAVIPRGKGYWRAGPRTPQKPALKTGRTRRPFGLSRTMLTRPIWTPLSSFQV